MMFLVVHWLSLVTVLFSSSLVQTDHQCHPWSFYNDTLQQCQCYETSVVPKYYTRHASIIECSETKVLMIVVYCMTSEPEGIFIGYCPMNLLNQNVMMVDGIYIQLPDNISELNDYMCGPVNRKGRVCNECIDGFGPAVTSIGYECFNCTSSWYGVPLYLFLEFVPITIFYLAVLFFQISMTSSPMTFCVMYSQTAVYFVIHLPNDFYLESRHAYIVSHVVTMFHGIWNLDFFRVIIPNFCISPTLKHIHIVFLGYISALYPVLLIVLTWVFIQLYSRNHQPFVWLWNKLNCLKSSRNSKPIVDIFATFFILSYTKLCFLSAIILSPSHVYQANSTQSYTVLRFDPSIRYFSKEHAAYAVVGGLALLVFGLLPALLLAAYPFRKLRSLFLIDRLGGRSNAVLNIFVEKFYSCYRDGLDGGRDMRSFASLHLFIRLLALLVCVSVWMPPTILYGVCCLLVLLVRPCKEPYMNNIDALILALLALNSFQFDKIISNSYYSVFHIWSLTVTACLPLLIIYGSLIPRKYLIKLKKKVKYFSSFRDGEEMQEELSDNDLPDPDRNLCPRQYLAAHGGDPSEVRPLLGDPRCALNPV